MLPLRRNDLPLACSSAPWRPRANSRYSEDPLVRARPPRSRSPARSTGHYASGAALMFRTNLWVPWLGLVCCVALFACSPAEDDGRSSNAPIQIPVGGAAGASGASAGVQAAAGGARATGTGVVGTPAGAPAPIVAGAPAPAGTAGRA